MAPVARLFPAWVVAILFLYSIGGACNLTSNEYLDKGRSLIATGNYDSAMQMYRNAIEADPSNYMAYYQRAIVYMGLGVSRGALEDLDKVLHLRPTYESAAEKRLELYIKLGRLDEARAAVTSMKADNELKKRVLETIEVVRTHAATGREFQKRTDYRNAIHAFSVALEHSSQDSALLLARARCREAVGEVGEAISDVSKATKVSNDQVDAYLFLSQLHYQNGDADHSLEQTRECLKLDPDRSDCFTFFKKLKKLKAALDKGQAALNNDDSATAVVKLEEARALTMDSLVFQAELSRRLCSSYLKNQDATKAVKLCTEALKYPDNDELSLLCDRGEAHLLNDDFAQAEADFREVLSKENGYKRAQEGMGRAERLKKRASQRDYYAILGVKKSATKAEIMKAFRKLALDWHPDKYDGEDKAKAEKKFIDISDAKEVLTDEDMRRRFDNGEDPLNPEQQQQQQHHHGGFPHFFHGGFPGGGFPGGGQFRGGHQQFHFFRH